MAPIGIYFYFCKKHFIMSKLNKRNWLLLLFSISFSISTYAQDAYVDIDQNEKIPVLLQLKTQLSKESKLSDRYKIQLFYGQLEPANKVLKDYRELDFDWSSNIEYETPNYKVWIGNFRNRLEADRALLILKEAFPNAFIFKPERN